MDTGVELLDVHKRYGDRPILTGFSLRAEPGEMLALTGPSGSGKSTILNMIGLLESPDAGEIRLLGDRAPRPYSRAANRLRRRHLGYLFQNFALIDDESVAGNLEVALTDSRGRGSKSRTIAAALDQVGLTGSEKRKIYSLSGGEQQRVAVARLLIKPCDIVLADEPAGSLDDDNRDVIMVLLSELNKEGRTVILATHDDHVAAGCARTIRLGTG
ncbi:ABC transporter ATP-binding protein [Actinoplanes sp. G11-F43]|uniref:ABC transporter ATP-binding protein n=1 Tax=Actinoplanes sp. G11-F43 TaxID=3424130 RepID=UPI003D33A382